VTVVRLAGYNSDDHFLLQMLKGVRGLMNPLPYHFPKLPNHFPCVDQSARAMLGTTFTSYEDKESSSTGWSSGQRQLFVAQVGHTFLLV